MDDTTAVVPAVEEISPGTESTETPETEETQEPAGEPPTGEPTEETESTETEESEEESLESDGKHIDARTRAAIAQLSKTPEGKQAAKAIKEAYFGNQEVLKEFPEAKHIGQAIRDIRTLKATLESIGGEEGISEMQSEIEDFRNEIKQFAEGDVALLEQLYQDNPESTVTAAQNVLDLLRSKNPTQFDIALAPSFDQRLSDAGFFNSIDTVMEFIKEGKGQEAYDEMLRVRNWAANVRRAAKMVTEGKTRVDPRDERLREREENVVKQEKEAGRRELSSQISRMHNASLEKVTRQLFAQLKLNGEGRRDFNQRLTNRVYAAMNKDKTFLRNFSALRAKGDMKRAARLHADKFEELLPDHFRDYRNSVYPNLPNGRPAAKGAGANNTKPGTTADKKPVAAINAMKRPTHEEVDWTKTTDTQWISGKRITLKNGKVINLNWSAIQA